MPHQCTTCGHTFEDGSKEMLGGCPDCGGNTFQFHPPGSDLPADPPADSDPPDREDPTGASAVGRAATRVRDFVSGTSGEQSGASGEQSPDPVGDRGADAADGPAPADLRDDGDVGVDVLETGDPDGAGADPETATTDGSPETSPTGSSAGAGSRTDRSSRRDSVDFSREPDPNAPWPTEADEDDPSGSGGDPARRSTSAAGDDIIDADARETERAIGDAEDPGERAPDVGSPGRDPESPSASGGARTASTPASESPESGAAPDDPSTRADAEADTGTPLDPDGDPAPDGDETGLAAAETAPAETAPAGEGQVVSEPSDDQPDLADLREQLNEQFESIKILEPGQYELNLMELYDREEYIIALQENGRYVIQVPENWMGDRPGEE